MKTWNNPAVEELNVEATASGTYEIHDEASYKETVNINGTDYETEDQHCKKATNYFSA